MLRIIPKLHNIKISIGAAHQMPLRSAPHPPYVLNRFHQSGTSYLNHPSKSCDKQTLVAENSQSDPCPRTSAHCSFIPPQDFPSPAPASAPAPHPPAELHAR